MKNEDPNLIGRALKTPANPRPVGHGSSGLPAEGVLGTCSSTRMISS